MQKLIQRLIDFRDARDWAQFHNAKDLAISLSLEAAELLELFQWKNAQEVEALKTDPDALQRVREELGDVLCYALLMAQEFGIDPQQAIADKIAVNEKKYPVDLVKGRADKYTAYRSAGS
jgi:dCTP diphosphatase